MWHELGFKAPTLSYKSLAARSCHTQVLHLCNRHIVTTDCHAVQMEHQLQGRNPKLVCRSGAAAHLALVDQRHIQALPLEGIVLESCLVRDPLLIDMLIQSGEYPHHLCHSADDNIRPLAEVEQDELARALTGLHRLAFCIC